ncbi:MAG: sulfur carrier protein ThiS [Arenicella sp.]|nr:sulfur carrier protein ThiS [Arenicella sp.]
MQIILNGEAITTNKTTLASLLIEQGYEGMVVATALNQLFVAKDHRDRTLLEDDCEIEIVAPMQGG